MAPRAAAKLAARAVVGLFVATARHAVAEGAVARSMASPFTCEPPMTSMDIVRHRDLTGQVHIVTGGDVGTGFEIVRALAAANASVVLGCRDAEAGAAAVARIASEVSSPRVAVEQVDLASFASVRRFAARVLQQQPKIDSVVLNERIAISPGDEPARTKDGFDRVMQVNFLSQFMLVEHLIPLLRRSRSRVVSMSSLASTAPCAWGALPEDCTRLDKLFYASALHNFTGENMFVAPASNYGLSKYLKVFHAAELARREPNLTAYSVSVGPVDADAARAVGQGHPECRGDPDCHLSAAEGAATPVFLAAAGPSEVLGGNGAFFGRCKPMMSPRTAMAVAIGEHGLIDYQKALYDMFL